MRDNYPTLHVYAQPYAPILYQELWSVLEQVITSRTMEERVLIIAFLHTCLKS